MSIDVMKQALEALVWEAEGWEDVPPITRDAITALRAAIEQAQQPVAWMYDLKQRGSFEGVSTEYSRVKLSIGENWVPLYTAPPQRKPLPPQSPCEMTQAEGKMFKLGWLECEAAHGIKENT